MLFFLSLSFPPFFFFYFASVLLIKRLGEARNDSRKSTVGRAAEPHTERPPLPVPLPRAKAETRPAHRRRARVLLSPNASLSRILILY